jgi:type IV secretory pathway protease TraF
VARKALRRYPLIGYLFVVLLTTVSVSAMFLSWLWQHGSHKAIWPIAPLILLLASQVGVGLANWLTTLPPKQKPTAPSLPLGFYRKTHGEITKGTLIAFCLPSDLAKYSKARGYVGEGKLCPEQTQLLIKPVVGSEGDVVEVQPEGVRINGVMIPHTPVFTTDLRGRVHEHLYLGVHTIPSGAVAVIAPSSFTLPLVGITS